jgi:peptidoglycan/LPS O-acetylase OafA/YrhL
MTNAVQSEPASDRMHALDAVRAGALLLGVFFHATLSFMDPRIWIIPDASEPSLPLGITFFVLHIFRMSVFFLLAGFFARMLLERRGLGGFIKDRAKRIVVPLAVFWPIVFTAIVTCFLWSAVQANGGTMPEGPPPPPLTAQTFPLTHLWFLYVLIIFYLGALGLRLISRPIDAGGWIGRVLDAAMRVIVRFRLEPIVFGAPVVAALWLKPDWYMWFGLPTPDTGLVPNLPAMLAFGGAFAFGWLLHRQIDLLQIWRRAWAPALLAAIAATGGALWLAGLTPELAPAAQDWRKLAFAVAYVIAIWTWTAGLIGAALTFLSGHSPARRYVSDASYWVYILHLPVMMAGQVLLAPLAWPALAKYAVLLAGVLAICFITYHLLVRYSFIGAILNGKKTPSRAKRDTQALAAAE